MGKQWDAMIDQERLVREFSRYVAIDSPSFGERQMCDELKKDMEALGMTVYEDDTGQIIGGTAGNLYARLPGTLDAPPLLFSAHMDTVEPSRGKQAVVHADGTITSKGDTVLGADDVSGIAAILEAIRSIREKGLPHRTIELFFSVAEEVYDRGSELVDMSRITAREAYVLDMSGEIGVAAYAAPTILSFAVEVTGHASHAGFAPEEGVHAIGIACDAVARIPMGRVRPEVTVNIGQISGGVATNIVPDHCRITGEIRSSQHEWALAQLEELTAVFEEEAQKKGGLVHISSRAGCKAYETPQDHPVIQRYEAVCKSNGIVPQLVKTFGGSDLNQLAQHGIAGLVIASAMFRVHSCQEYTTVQALTEAAGLTMQLMLSRS